MTEPFKPADLLLKAGQEARMIFFGKNALGDQAPLDLGISLQVVGIGKDGSRVIHCTPLHNLEVAFRIEDTGRRRIKPPDSADIETFRSGITSATIKPRETLVVDQQLPFDEVRILNIARSRRE